MKFPIFFLIPLVLWTAPGCNADPASPKPMADERLPAPAPLSADTLPPPENEPAILDKKGDSPKIKPSSGPPVPNQRDHGDEYAKQGFRELVSLDRSIALDIRYATANNFTKSKIYDCPRCLLRPEAADALVRVHKALKKKGLGLKMFDCYRPQPYQQRLWDKVPNPNYVTPPDKGSMHSRGLAVDLTLVDAEGHELDMGTPYDFFGQKAHTDYTKLPAVVLQNRSTLREAMEAEGFKGIRTEWWHFSFTGKNYPLAKYVWPCQ